MKHSYSSSNKKGVSEVVATVLIILLAIAAIALIWAFIAPTLSKTGAQLSKADICLTNKVEVISCKVFGANQARVAVTRSTNEEICTTCTNAGLNKVIATSVHSGGEIRTVDIPLTSLATNPSSTAVDTLSASTPPIKASVTTEYQLVNQNGPKVTCTSPPVDCLA